MADIFTPEKRSYVMSRIRSRGTKPELRMRDLLRQSGLKFKMHPKLPGTPDFLVGGRIAVFVNGDFWHGWDYRNGRIPRQKYWRDKIEGNMARDRRVQRKLRYQGYSVLNFWEHQINKRGQHCVGRIMAKATFLGVKNSQKRAKTGVFEQKGS